MMRPTQETIDTFTSITGASESVALQKLEEYGGNVNEAVNAYFCEGHRDITNPTAAASSRLGIVDMNNNNIIQDGPSRLSQLINAARSFRPSSLLDSNYRRSLVNELGASSFTTRPPVVSTTGGVTGVPSQFSCWNEQPHHPGMPYGYYGLTNSSYNKENLLRDEGSLFYGNDVEDQMVQAAIEASKRENSSGSGSVQREQDFPEDDEFSRAISLSIENSSGSGSVQSEQDFPEDDEFSCAISFSMKTAEQEKTMREQGVQNQEQLPQITDLGTEAEKTISSTRKVQSGNLPAQDGAEYMRARSPVSYKPEHDVDVHAQRNKDVFSANEWGGLSSKELDEAVMLEAALFGEATTDRSKNLQSGLDRNAGPSSSSGSRTSPSSVMARQSPREQQDDEYLASLLADREKETIAQKEAESQKKILKEEKLERWLAAKETSLPQEPAVDNENAVSLLVKMPDGSRHGRRFLESDRLQVLFDFIDVGRAVKPGTYRVVRPYPRRAFSVSDGSLSLNELGLTNKQEALFLEFI